MSAGGKEIPEIKTEAKHFDFKRQFFAAYFLSNQSMMYPRNYEIEELFPINVVLSYYRSTWLAMCHE